MQEDVKLLPDRGPPGPLMVFAGGAPLQWRDHLLPGRRRATGVARPQPRAGLEARGPARL